MTDSLPARQHHSIDTDIDTSARRILELIQSSFAYMDTRIDPPSSMHRLDVAAIVEHCNSGEVWSIGSPLHACVFLKLKPNALYLGRLAVSRESRKQGIAQSLVLMAEQRARIHNKPVLELETRVELTENHAFFEKLGFIKTADGTHDGYTQPTYIVMQRPVQH